MSRCPHCPCPPGYDCAATRFPVYCDWARDGVKSGVNLILDKSAGRLPDAPAPEADPDPDPDPLPIVATAHAVPFDAAEFAAIRACPHRFKENCGCAWPYRCRASYGQPATVEDCRRCLRARSGE